MSKTQPTHLKTGAHRATRFAMASFSCGRIINRILPVTLVWRDGTAKQGERE
jgi:hypothetical protein